MTITNAIVTAYCACRVCCGASSPEAGGLGLTAAGTKPIASVTVAGPRNVKLGTQVIIGGRRYTVQDRTSKRFDGRWDVYMPTHQQAVQWGRKRLNVTVLQRSPMGKSGE